MKTFFLLAAVLLLSHFDGSTGQDDADRRLEAFLQDSLASFPRWMQLNGWAPAPLPSRVDGIMTISGDYTERGRNYCNFVAKFTERFFHGVAKNFRALSIKSNLKIMSYSIDLAFGNGTDDTLQGKYSIVGSASNDFFQINQTGDYIKRQQTLNPLHQDELCDLKVTTDGYFRMPDCVGYVPKPRFETLELKDFEVYIWTEEITEMINGWYNAQMHEFPPVVHAYMQYMAEVFAKTPVVDIIGRTLPPTVAASSKKITKSDISSTRLRYDAQQKMWLEKVSIKY